MTSGEPHGLHTMGVGTAGLRVAFLHGLFVVEDKLSMAHSLESRVPFMDNDLVDFAMRVPVSLKLRDLTEVVRLNENEPGP